jgi:lysyl-tRNA synthetase, class I
MVNSKAWPFEEARKILEKINNKTPEKGYVLFETGYGPSGLPHIGTFGEVARTTMVLNAFKQLSDIPTKLYAFSDDLDGMRKVPDNLPNHDMLVKNIGKSLTNIPDPFEEFPSFAENMNAKLKSFLDQFNFGYEFKSSTEIYQSGGFDKVILSVLSKFDEIMAVMLPTLGDERQSTYSPILPICQKTGIVLQVPIISRDVEKGTITYFNPNTNQEETSLVTGGKCKLQWKSDWAMRWAAFDVDYEMHGKDLIPTANLSSKICKIIGGSSPVLFNYELFLDEEGKKISKSKGNGISIDHWLSYATTESLSLFMYQSPKKAKRLHFDVIPKNVDDYITFLQKYNEEEESRFDNPVWHIHSGKVDKIELYGLTFALLINIASACNAGDTAAMWGFISQYAAGAVQSKSPYLDKLVEFAVKFYNDFVKPNKKYRKPTIDEIKILQELKEVILNIEVPNAENIQNAVYALGKKHNYDNLREFFMMLYEVLLGKSDGPRVGTFIEVYGIENSAKLIDKFTIDS